MIPLGCYEVRKEANHRTVYGSAERTGIKTNHTMGHQRSYSWEFKLQMVQLLEKGELNPSQISRDHHVTRSLLYVWWQLYRE
jgi:transposase-like protein